MFIDIILIIVFLSLLILVHEAGHFLAAKYFGLRVDEFGFGFPPRLFRKKRGETVYSFNLLPLGGFVKIYGEEGLDDLAAADKKRSFAYQPAWKRFIIIAAGVAMNFVFGWIFLSAVLMIGSKPVLIIDDVQAGSPAAAAGLQKRDQVLEISRGREFLKPAVTEEFINFVSRFRGENFSVKIFRAGEIKTLTVGSRVNPPAGEGSMGVLISSAGIKRHSFLAGLSEGFKNSLKAGGLIIKAFYQLLATALVDRRLIEGVTGPVGIFAIASQANQLGFVYFLQLVGLISINLGVINIMPFPALDGGRILFILIEKIKGSALRPRTEQLINITGLAFLLLLMAIITVKDIARIL